MPNPRKGIPSYCLHRPSGKAVVRLNGRDHSLGSYGTVESRLAYDRVIAEWLASGRRVEAATPIAGKPTISVNEVLLAFLDFAERYYRDGDEVSKEVVNFKLAFRPVKQLYGSTTADQFGPLALKALRQHMIEVQDLCRKEVNKRIGRVKRVFKWAVSEELIPSSVFEGLRTVEGLRVGRTTARENAPVKPVDDVTVEATLRFVSPQIKAMVQLQRLTGLRPGEVTIMRPCDIDCSDEIWVYRPTRHKTTHLGVRKEVPFGPKSQELLRPFLNRAPDAFLFSPREAEDWRNERRAVRRDPPRHLPSVELHDSPSPQKHGVVFGRVLNKLSWWGEVVKPLVSGSLSSQNIAPFCHSLLDDWSHAVKWVAGCLMLVGLAALDPPYDAARELAAIAKVGPQGEGSAAAKVARDELAKHGVEVLPPLLVAMDTSNAVAANWYRTVYEEIVARELARDGTKWPVEFFKEYISDAKRVGRPRRLVLALLDKLEPEFRASWLPTRLDDAEFRYEAVGLALTAGDRAVKDKDQTAAKTEFRTAFEAARDSTQVTQAAAKLKSLGESADVVQHLGLFVDWWLVGPFDAPAKTGFAAVFAPEKKLDLQAKYRGQGGTEIAWKRHHETDTLGQLDLNKQLGTTREAVGYAYSEIDVPREQAAQVRCGADDNCSVWLNGEKVFGRDQWLNGTRFDRFVTPIQLKAGRNTLLVKVCQGPQHKDPEVPNNWSLQLRLCDEQGRGIEFKPMETEK